MLIPVDVFSKNVNYEIIKIIIIIISIIFIINININIIKIER